MKKINDYLCEVCDSIFEDLGDNTMPCPECSTPSKKIISTMNFRLPGTDPAYTTAWDKWAKDHEKAAKHRQGREDWENPDL